MTEQPVDPRPASADGFWRWTGHSWVPMSGSMISPDGRWRWDGTSWQRETNGSSGNLDESTNGHATQVSTPRRGSDVPMIEPPTPPRPGMQPDPSEAERRSSGIETRTLGKSNPTEPPSYGVSRGPKHLGALAVAVVSIVLTGAVAISLTSGNEGTPAGSNSGSVGPSLTRSSTDFINAPGTTPDTFLEGLREDGVSFSSRQNSLNVAQHVCQAFEANMTFNEILQGLASNNPQLTALQFEGVILGATLSFCPKYASQATLGEMITNQPR